MGRLTYHVENTGERAGVSRTFSRTATYDRTGLVTNETTYTYLRADSSPVHPTPSTRI